MFLSAAGVGRRTRTGAVTHRRLWRCNGCRRQFSALTGTLLAGTRLPLPTWLTAAAHRDVTGAAELARLLGTSTEAARRVRATFAQASVADDAPVEEVVRALLAPADGTVASRRARPGPDGGPTTGPSADYR